MHKFATTNSNFEKKSIISDMHHRKTYMCIPPPPPKKKEIREKEEGRKVENRRKDRGTGVHIFIMHADISEAYSDLGDKIILQWG